MDLSAAYFKAIPTTKDISPTLSLFEAYHVLPPYVALRYFPNDMPSEKSFLS